MKDVQIREFTPRDAGWVLEQHAELYARENGFDATFAGVVDEVLTAFIADYDADRDRAWIAQGASRRLGCVFCAQDDGNLARLRLFLLLPEARGKGIGKALLATCVAFAKDRGYAGIWLWTHESHKAACALYRRTGWTLDASRPVHSFGQDLVEQRWHYRF